MKYDQTKLGYFDRTIDGCKVITIPAGATPKSITVELPGDDSARVLAWWTGFPAGLAVNDYVEVRYRPNGRPQYVITGTSAGTGTISAGWPFAHVLTVSTTDPDADYATVAAAIAAASAGDAILLEMETSSETITANKAVTLIGWSRAGTVFTNTITITSAATLINIKVSIAAGTNSKGFVISANTNLLNCEAVTAGSSTSRGVEISAGTTYIAQGYYEATGAGTSYEVFVSGGGAILEDPILSGGGVSGSVQGTYRNSLGYVAIAALTQLRFESTASQTGGVWLIDESALLKTKEATLAAAITAAASSGDTIKLDTDTYTVTGTLSLGKSLTIEGDGPEATIIDFTGSNQAAFDFDTDSTTIIFRNITAKHTGGGTAATVGFSNNAVTVILDNAQFLVPSGGPTDARALWIEAGTWELRNGAKAKSTSGTNKYGIYNDAGSATITIGAGCEVGGATADIYGDQTGSTLKNFGLLTNGIVDFAGINARGLIQVMPNEPILMNGHPLIWQRGTSFAAAADGTYFADRFAYFKSGVMVHTLAQDASVPTIAQIGSLFNYSMLVDCTTVDGTIAAGDFTIIRYIVEGYDWLKLAQQQFTIPFWVSATKTGVYCFAVSNSGADRSYVAEYTVNAADTWEYKQITVPASPSAGTWDYISGIGARLIWTLAGGSTYQTTAGAWQTGFFFSTSNQVNACDNTANNFRLIVGDPLPGAYARPVVPNVYGNYQALLDRCQRYAWLIAPESGNNQGQGTKFSNTTIGIQLKNPTTMRAAPALTHNITGYTAGTPGTTTIGLIDYARNTFYAITGALTVSLAAGGVDYSNLQFVAGTSWDGTAGNLSALRVGPDVKAILAPSDYS